MSLHSIKRCSSKGSAEPSSLSAALEDGAGEAEVDYIECRTVSDRPYMIEWVNENWAETLGDTCYHPIISILKGDGMWNKMVENDLYLKLGEDLLEIVCGVTLDLGGEIRRARIEIEPYYPSNRLPYTRPTKITWRFYHASPDESFAVEGKLVKLKRICPDPELETVKGEPRRSSVSVSSPLFSMLAAAKTRSRKMKGSNTPRGALSSHSANQTVMGTPILGAHSAVRSLSGMRSSSPGGHSAMFSPGSYNTPQRAPSATRDEVWVGAAEIDEEGGGEGVSNGRGCLRGLALPSPRDRFNIPLPRPVDSTVDQARSGGRTGREHGLGATTKHPSPPRMAPPSYVPISNLRLRMAPPSYVPISNLRLDAGWSDLKKSNRLNLKSHLRPTRGTKGKGGGWAAVKPAPISPYAENLVKQLVVSSSSPRGSSRGPPSFPRGNGGMSRGGEGLLRRRRSSTLVPYPGKGEGEGKEGSRGEGRGEEEKEELGGVEGRSGEETLDAEGKKNGVGVDVDEEEELATAEEGGAGAPAVKEVVSGGKEDGEGEEEGGSGGGQGRGDEGEVELEGLKAGDHGAPHATSVASEMDLVGEGKGHVAAGLEMGEGVEADGCVADAGAAEAGDAQIVDESIELGGAEPVQEAVQGGALLEESAPIVEGAQETAPIVGGAQETAPIVEGAQETAPIVGGAQQTAPIVEGAQETAPIVGGAQQTAPIVGGVQETSPILRRCSVSRGTRISGSDAARAAAVGKRLLGRVPSSGEKVGARDECLAGDSCFYRGDLVSADKEYSRRLEGRADDADLLLKLASLKERQGLPEMAADAYRKVLSVPGCISAYYCSAAARLSLITFETDEGSGEHLRLIAESLSRDPDHVETLDAKCFFIAKESPSEARVLHRRVCRLDPSHVLHDCPYAKHIFPSKDGTRDQAKGDGDDDDDDDDSGRDSDGNASEGLESSDNQESLQRVRRSSVTLLLGGMLASPAQHPHGTPGKSPGTPGRTQSFGRAHSSSTEGEFTQAEVHWCSMTAVLLRRAADMSFVKKALVVFGLDHHDEDEFHSFVADQFNRVGSGGN